MKKNVEADEVTLRARNSTAISRGSLQQTSREVVNSSIVAQELFCMSKHRKIPLAQTQFSECRNISQRDADAHSMKVISAQSRRTFHLRTAGRYGA
jgi:hypothetical protein